MKPRAKTPSSPCACRPPSLSRMPLPLPAGSLQKFLSTCRAARRCASRALVERDAQRRAARQVERNFCKEPAGRGSGILLREGGRQAQGDEGVFARGFITSCLSDGNNGALRILYRIGLRRCHRHTAGGQQDKKRYAQVNNHRPYTFI